MPNFLRAGVGHALFENWNGKRFGYCILQIAPHSMDGELLSDDGSLPATTGQPSIHSTLSMNT